MRNPAGSWLEGESATESQKITILEFIVSSKTTDYNLKKMKPRQTNKQKKQTNRKIQGLEKFSDLHFSSICI